MKLLLSSLLLASLCALSSWSVSSGTLIVTQSPDVSVMEGETVNITCCWTLEFDRIRVTWRKNQTRIESLKNHHKGSDCSQLTFNNVSGKDSGRYICRVTEELPLLSTVDGNGTVITVTARNSTTEDTAGGSHREEVFIYVLRCLPILALVATFFYLNNLRTKPQQHTSAVAGNNLTASQRREENQEEEKRDEREIEAE